MLLVLPNLYSGVKVLLRFKKLDILIHILYSGEEIHTSLQNKSTVSYSPNSVTRGQCADQRWWQYLRTATRIELVSHGS